MWLKGLAPKEAAKYKTAVLWEYREGKKIPDSFIYYMIMAPAKETANAPAASAAESVSGTDTTENAADTADAAAASVDAANMTDAAVASVDAAYTAVDLSTLLPVRFFAGSEEIKVVYDGGWAHTEYLSAKTEPESETENAAEPESGLEAVNEIEPESELESADETELESESESESEPEAALLEFACEGDGVSVRAYVSPEAGIPENAVLHAERLQEGSESYENAMREAREGLGLAENEELFFVPYDVYFSTEESGKIEPDGAVRVEMEYAGSLFEDVAETAADDDPFVIHIKNDGEVEKLDNASGTYEGAQTEDMSGLSFDVQSFSIMGPAMISLEGDADGQYAILYDDGELVFQIGDTPEEGREVAAKWSGFEGGSPWPWTNDDYKAKVISVNFKNEISVTTCETMFSGLVNMETFQNANLLNTSAANSMDRMFSGCNSLRSLYMSNWNTSNVTNMNQMFNGCNSLQSLDTGNWDVGNVSGMWQMFNGCNSLEKLNTTNWNTVQVTNMEEMFNGCNSLRELDVSGWKTDHVQTMNSMFNNCEKLQGLDASRWNTQSVTKMENMFNNCKSLQSLDLESWDTQYVQSMWKMFSNCSALQELQISNWNTRKVGNMADMFNGCSMLKSLNISGWTVSNVGLMNGMFSGCSSLQAMDLSSWDTSSASNMCNMFYGCSSLQSLTTGESWKTDKVTDMSNMFYGCGKLQELEVGGWQTGQVTKMQHMFDGCEALKNLNVTNWDTSRVSGLSESMDSMFSNCRSLESLDVSKWSVDNVENMNQMFNGCNSLKTLDMSNWNTAGNPGMWYMFNGCDSLEKLVLGSEFSFTGSDQNLSGEWIRVSDGERYSEGSLVTEYDGSTMSGTYSKAIKIIFDGNGGAAVPDSFDGYLDMTVDTLPTATRKGYDFAGWWTDPLEEEEGTELIKNSDGMYTLAQNAYYAHWKGHQYTLLLYACDTNDYSYEKILSYGDFFRLPDKEFPDGKVFENGTKVLVGWNTRRDGSGESYGPNEEIGMLTEIEGETVTLYAQWREPDDDITISFDTGEGGSKVNPKKVKPREEIELPTAERKNHTLTAWRKGSKEGDRLVLGQMYRFEESCTLYAEWQEDPVISFYIADGGALWMQKRVKYNTPLGELPELPTYYYNYMSPMGWFTKTAEGNLVKVDEIASVTSNIDIYAKWGWKPKFNANGGNFKEGTVTFEVQEEPNYQIEELPEVEQPGYKFLGWYYLEAGEEKELKAGDTIDLQKGIEISAKWEYEGTVKLTLDPNGGSIDNSTASKEIEVLKGVKVSELPIPTRDGWDFLGWTDNNGIKYTAESEFTDDTVLVAQWAQRTVTVTFNAEGGQFPGGGTEKKIQVAAGSTIENLPGASKENYILEGWFDDSGNELNADTPISSDITYHARWSEFQKSTEVDSKEYTYGVEWLNVSNENCDNVGGNLNFHPVDGTAKQTAELRVRFELNLASDETIPAGALRITIPKDVWKDRNGNPCGENSLMKELLPYKEGESTADFAYIEQGDTLVIVNAREIVKEGREITVHYTVDPWKVPGGAVDSNGRYADESMYKYYKNDNIKVTFDILDKDNEPVEIASETLSLEMHTKVETSQWKGFNEISYGQWNETWGEEPPDAKDYFYITWRLHETTKDATSQPYTLTWSEDTTVHDGTVVYMTDSKNESIEKNGQENDCYVVTRHPISLLKNIPQTGREIHNEAIVTEKWASGYTTSHRVSANYTLYASEYPTGEFDKHRQNYSADEASENKLIPGGQEVILEDNKEILMQYELLYTGGSNEKPTWNEATHTYEAKSRTICMQDGVSGQGDVMYSSGSPAARYVWEPATGNIALSDDDYYFRNVTIVLTEYDAAQVDNMWSKPYVYTRSVEPEPVDIYVRYSGSEEFVYYKSVDIKGKPPADWASVDFGENKNVVGIEIRHESDFFSTQLRVKTDMYLRPTQKVRALIENDVAVGATSLIKNRAYCKIWLTDDETKNLIFNATNDREGNHSASKEIYELNISETKQFTKKYASDEAYIVGNPDKRVQDNPISISGWDYNTSPERRARIKTGVFYDLLPRGTTVDPDTVFGIPVMEERSQVNLAENLANHYMEKKNDTDKLDSGFYDVRFVENWEGSNRTMMEISFVIPESISAVGVDFYYLLHNTYENIIANGTTTKNDVAFVNTTEGRVKPSELAGGIDEVTEQYYKSLEEKYKGYISYAAASTNYNFVGAISWNFSKSVKTQTEYNKKDETLLNNLYTYRLTYGQSDSTDASNIVFYDILENGFKDESNVELKSDWHGELVTVDTREIAEKLTNANGGLPCKPVVLYSTKKREDFTESDLDINNEDIWKKERPEGEITAIAVDCTKDTEGNAFVLNGNKTMNVYITLRAPKDSEGIDVIDGATARNEAVIKKSLNGEPITPMNDHATVTLRDMKLEPHKTANPLSGTEEDPALLHRDDILTYTLSVKNTGEFTLNDIVMEDTIPEGLLVNTKDITVYLGKGEETPDKSKAVPIASSPRAEVARSGQTLTFTISSLLPGETIYFDIPCTVNVSGATFTNQATITSVNDVSKALKTEETYHKSVPMSILVKKKGLHGAGLEGAVMQLYKVANSEAPVISGTQVYEWITDGNVKVIDDAAVSEWMNSKEGTSGSTSTTNILEPGTYRIHEESAPSGYLLAEDVIIELAKDSRMTVVEILPDGREKRTLVDTVEIQDTPVYDLSVEKKVTGSGGDREKEFTFTLHLEVGEEGYPLPKELKYKKSNVTAGNTVETLPADSDGNYKFKLKHGEKIEFLKIPYGTRYTITETNADGYEVTVAASTVTGAGGIGGSGGAGSGGTGSGGAGGGTPDTDNSITGEVEEATNITFTNHKSAPVMIPVTGGPGTFGLMLMSLLLCLIGCIIIYVAGGFGRKVLPVHIEHCKERKGSEMKKGIFKKLGMFVLGTILAAGLCAPLGASATAAADQTITINANGQEGIGEGNRFVAYCIFTGTLGSDENELVGIEWGTGVDHDALITALQDDETTKKTFDPAYTKWETDDKEQYGDAEMVAKWLAAQTGNTAVVERFAELAAECVGKNGTDSTYDTAASAWKITVPGSGYYLVKDTYVAESAKDQRGSVSSYILQVIGNAEVDLKASLPTVDKKVQNQDGWLTETSTEVEYTLTGTVSQNIDAYETYVYKFTDTLSKGLTYDVANKDTNLSVKVGNETDGYKTLETTAYSVTYDDDFASGGHILTIEIDNLKSCGLSKPLTKDSKVVVTYKATLNKDAVEGTLGNNNTVKLEYSNNPYSTGKGTSNPDEVKTYTIGLNVTKVDGNTPEEMLADVGFKLKKGEQYAKMEEDTATGTYTILSWGDETDATEMKTGGAGDKEGQFHIKGLDAGTYTLVETTPPKDYEPMKDIVFDIAGEVDTVNGELKDVSAKLDSADALREDVEFDNGGAATDGVLSVTLKNYKAPILPHTGGIGAMVIVAVSSIVVLFGVVVLALALRKKKNA